MKLKLWVATVGALLAMPAYVLAQQSPHPADPADPRAAVPAAGYESVFTSISRPTPEPNAVTPDKVWRAANDTVAGAQGHAGHGAGAATASGHAAHQAGAAAASGNAHAAHAMQAVPAPSAKPVDRPAADHSKHH